MTPPVFHKVKVTMLRGLISAIRTLTIIPVPGRDAGQLSDALPWFPVVGGMLGFILLGLGLVLNFAAPGWPLGTAAIVVMSSAVLTRGLHLDGVADWFDALGGGRNPERMLAIMKDSNVGAFGVLALVLVLLLKWVSIVYLLENDQMIYIVGIYVVSRTSMVELAVCLPYARADGGTGAPFVSTAKKWQRYAAWALSLLLLSGLYGLAGCILFLAGGVMTWMLGAWFYRRISGITGDLLGTCCELVETGLLLFIGGLIPFL